MVNLNEASFPSAVMGSGDLWFVEFYAPWYALSALCHLILTPYVQLPMNRCGTRLRIWKERFSKGCSSPCRCGHCKNLKPEYIELAKYVHLALHIYLLATPFMKSSQLLLAGLSIAKSRPHWYPFHDDQIARLRAVSLSIQ